MHRFIIFLSCLPLGVVVALSVGACKKREFRGDLASVDIPQSEVKNKKKIGFCWAYATTDFLESEYKKTRGGTINLSEEALGFYRIAEHLLEIVKGSKSDQEIITKIGCQRFQGLHILKVNDRQRSGGFELAEQYGVIPEDVYSVKFETETQRTDTILGIRERMRFLLERKSRDSITQEDIETQVIVKPPQSQSRPSNFVKRPPVFFDYEGRRWTAKEFFNSKFDVTSSRFVKLEFNSIDEYPRFVTLVKKTLASGTSVPFGFGVDRNYLFQEGGVTVFSGKRSVFDPSSVEDPYPPKPDPLKESGCPPKVMRAFAQGKHAVVITDFVNEGGMEGGLGSSDDLQREVARPASELVYLKVKNNWGIDEAGDEEGSSWLSSKDGYYRVDRQYIIGHLEAGISMNIIVPRAIVEAIHVHGGM